MKFLSEYKPYLIFSGLFVCGLAVILIISSGLYPIALVNGKFLSARTLEDHLQAESIYYQNFLKTYTTPDTKIEKITVEDLKKFILTKLIENVLVNNEVEKKLGNDLNVIIEDRIQKITQDQKLEKAATAIYGLTFEDFREEILVPLAKEDILAGRLFLEGQNFDDWLASAKKLSKVKIFSTNFYWDGEEVQTKP